MKQILHVLNNFGKNQFNPAFFRDGKNIQNRIFLSPLLINRNKLSKTQKKNDTVRCLQCTYMHT